MGGRASVGGLIAAFGFVLAVGAARAEPLPPLPPPPAAPPAGGGGGERKAALDRLPRRRVLPQRADPPERGALPAQLLGRADGRPRPADARPRPPDRAGPPAGRRPALPRSPQAGPGVRRDVPEGLRRRALVRALAERDRGLCPDPHLPRRPARPLPR